MGAERNQVTAGIEPQIRQMIVERCFLTVEPEDIGDDDDLMETVGLDSVQILEVVVGLEEVFGVSFEESDFDIAHLSTVGAIAHYVRSKQPA